MNRMNLSLALCAALASCSESPVATDVPSATDMPVVSDRNAPTDTGADASPPTDRDPAADVAPADGGAGDAGGSDAATDAGATDVGTTDLGTIDAGALSGVVVNELRATGDDWVELYNAGTTTVDLSGFGMADTDTDGGAPRLTAAVRFPSGTTLAPGAYLFVLANQSDAGAGPQTACLDGGPSRCFHAGWGISASRGETISLVNSRDEVILRGVFPANAVATGQSYGRLPNGTGAFAANRPTPGAANLAP